MTDQISPSRIDDLPASELSASLGTDYDDVVAAEADLRFQMGELDRLRQQVSAQETIVDQARRKLATLYSRAEVSAASPGEEYIPTPNLHPAPGLTMTFNLNDGDDSNEENKNSKDSNNSGDNNELGQHARTDDEADAFDVIGVGRCGRCGAKLPLDMESIEAHTIDCEREFRLKKSRFMNAVRASMGQYITMLLDLGTPGATPVGSKVTVGGVGGGMGGMVGFGGGGGGGDGGMGVGGGDGGENNGNRDDEENPDSDTINQNEQIGGSQPSESSSPTAAANKQPYVDSPHPLKNVDEILDESGSLDHFGRWIARFRESGEEATDAGDMEESLRPLWMELVENTKRNGGRGFWLNALT